MEDEASSSLLSHVKTHQPADEASDSNFSDCALPAAKRPRLVHDLNVLAAVGKFKGVVPQHNGRWGAQIYANHQRIWLGTFKSERDAAMAYDSAAIKLRTRDSHRNFPWTRRSIEEPNFQINFSTDAVLSMIKDGSYSSKFSAYLRTKSQIHDSDFQNPRSGFENGDGDGHFSCSHLFQKELTPSDVGKLNRLVIPKKYAVKHFPYISESADENGDDIEIVFYDTAMKTWKFRYCYWRSSQSFVFTRGWNRFVKEKKLKANDIITFYTYESCGGGSDENGGSVTLNFIDVIYKKSEDRESESSCLADKNEKLQSGLGLNREKDCGKKKKEVEEILNSGVMNPNEEKIGEKRIRLFGVHID
ncbi:AP2/ERF and B3 domain-containing transcription factor At1g50680-like [Momordica charantia]|uniref:AP2/ERF and B3 domain-containing transcription factor At1g50680-like n=1 Tax=Momordica charantia TaxID=3673 RepID=A0A6J1DJD2_MOMCH|nr:AP2/ERF and B3 domain-containing transcription factor At1g50680-like [Momordica charantia]